jgi:hypothetical protein
MPGNTDFARFMAAGGVRSLNEKCFDGWITVDRWNGDITFCRLPVDKAIPFVWRVGCCPSTKAPASCRISRGAGLRRQSVAWGWTSTMAAAFVACARA